MIAANLDDLETQIKEHGITREFLTEIIAHGAALPPLARGAAFIVVQRMGEPELQKFAGIALEALQYAKREDLDGLIAYLKQMGIPAPMVEVLRQYGSNFLKNE